MGTNALIHWIVRNVVTCEFHRHDGGIRDLYTLQDIIFIVYNIIH